MLMEELFKDAEEYSKGCKSQGQGSSFVRQSLRSPLTGVKNWSLLLEWSQSRSSSKKIKTSEEETRSKRNHVNVVEALKHVDNTRIQKEVASVPSNNAEHVKGNLCLFKLYNYST